MVEVKENEEAGDGEGEGRPGNQKGDRQRETDSQVTHQPVHCDALCIRTKRDCSAT